MIVTRQIFHHAEFRLLVNNPAGGIQRHILLRADQVVEKAKENVSVPYIRGTLSDGVFPRRRTGDLQRGIEKFPAVVKGIQGAVVVTDSQHRGYGYAAAFETGEDLASHLHPLPYLKPALEEVFRQA